MIVENLIFWTFATLAVLSALGVVFHRSIIYAALFLIVVFLSIAGFFVLNNADFLAVAQLIVYAVGLTIVLLFGIMFTGDRQFKDGTTRTQALACMVVGGLALGLLLPAAIYAYRVVPTPPSLAAILSAQGTTELLGGAIFTTYLLPFEMVSVLLLLAMIGAIILSKKAFAGPRPGVKYELRTSQLSPEAEQAFHKAFPEHEEVHRDGESHDSEKVGV